MTFPALPAATVLALAAAGWVAQAAPASASGIGAHLSWVRDDGAAGCPDAAAIQSEVTRRLGDDPFRRTPTQFIEAMVTRPGDTYQVTIAMRATNGTLIGNRTLTSAAGDCGSISAAAALTIAILIDPDALARPAAPPPAASPPPPPPRPAPAPAGVAGRVTAVVAAGWGALPGVAASVGGSAVIDVTDHVAIGAIASLLPERRAAPPDDGFAFGLSYGGVVACYVPTATSAPGLRWELCAGATGGVLHAVVYAPYPIDPGQRWYVAATQLTRLIIPVPVPALAAATIEAGIEASEPFPRRAFFVEGRPAGMDTVFTQPAVALTASLGVGLRWK